MGVSKKVNSVHKIEIRELKAKIKKMSMWKYKYPGQLTSSRRLDFAIKINEMSERIEYLRRNKTGSKEYEFTYVLKKRNVTNRTMPKEVKEVKEVKRPIKEPIKEPIKLIIE